MNLNSEMADNLADMEKSIRDKEGSDVADLSRVLFLIDMLGRKSESVGVMLMLSLIGGQVFSVMERHGMTTEEKQSAMDWAMRMSDFVARTQKA